MHRNNIIIVLIIVLIIVYLLRNRSEHLDSAPTPLSNEAIQNIASVYADTKGTTSFNNVNVTGQLNVSGWKGMIVMWSGSLDKVPTGWALCDGQNGTPDLSGKFIIGFNTKEIKDEWGNLLQKPTKIGDTGGSAGQYLKKDQIPGHTHTLNSYMPTGNPDNAYRLGGENNWGHLVNMCIQDKTNKKGLGNCGIVKNDLRYPMTSLGDVGGGDALQNPNPFSILPPYYALAYIIKL